MTGVKLPWYKGKQSKVKYSSSTGRLNTLVLANNVAVTIEGGVTVCRARKNCAQRTENRG